MKEDFTDHHPDLGASTPEPSLRQIVLAYYMPHFPEEEAYRLTDEYLEAIKRKAAE